MILRFLSNIIKYIFMSIESNVEGSIVVQDFKDSMERKLKIAYITIGLSIIYILVVLGFVVTSKDAFLVSMEVVTMISAPVILILIISLLDEVEGKNKMWKQSAIASLTCSMTLTVLAHFVNLTVTRNLQAKGMAVPDYFQIGKWPSVEMAADYLAWGFFLGLAFLCASAAYPVKSKSEKSLKGTLMTCGFLCLFGLSGPVFNNEVLWFISVAGYAIGLPIISIQLIQICKKRQINDLDAAV